MTTRIDLRRRHAGLYRATATPALVEVPELPFLLVDGRGDPNTSAAYADALRALYAVAYTLRFGLKRAAEAIDAPVMPLEGLWWAPDMSAFTTGDRSSWHWTLMILQPDEVTPELVDRAREDAARKAPPDAVAAVRLDRFAEGAAAQVLHTGPYADEGPTIARLHRFIADRGYLLAGRHHEIYLGDPRRAAPERLRTILRQPVRLPGADGQR